MVWFDEKIESGNIRFAASTWSSRNIVIFLSGQINGNIYIELDKLNVLLNLKL